MTKSEIQQAFRSIFAKVICYCLEHGISIASADFTLKTVDDDTIELRFSGGCVAILIVLTAKIEDFCADFAGKGEWSLVSETPTMETGLEDDWVVREHTGELIYTLTTA